MENIEDMPFNERPREKMLYLGAQALSNAELIAVLLGSGSKEYPITRVAADLVEAADNRPELIASMTITQLCNVRGIGKTRSLTIMAAMELGKRAIKGQSGPPLIKTSKAVADLLKPYFVNQDKASYFLVMLNQQKELLATSELAFIEEDKDFDVSQVIAIAHDAKAAEIIICRLMNPMPEKWLAQEKAFLVQLDDAASMLKIETQSLFLKY